MTKRDDVEELPPGLRARYVSRRHLQALVEIGRTWDVRIRSQVAGFDTTWFAGGVLSVAEVMG
jgi:hypothetical protein